MCERDRSERCFAVSPAALERYLFGCEFEGRKALVERPRQDDVAARGRSGWTWRTWHKALEVRERPRDGVEPTPREGVIECFSSHFFLGKKVNLLSTTEDIP